ncbi:hypothetical protein ZC59_003304 [Salmonella enterica subsp. salamae]|nr:hypothetical protein [Salmonella enterica subsp. salamae]
MRKNVFDEGLSDSFIQYIIELQALDTRSTKQPVYREKLDSVFGVMSDRFLSRLRENVGELDTSALTLDRALSYYVQVVAGELARQYTEPPSARSITFCLISRPRSSARRRR